MKKILIIGSKGMAGHVIYYYLKESGQFNVVDISRDDQFFKSSYKIDITQFDKLKIILNEERPDVVINCIGILNKDAEDHPEKAILLNSYLPHFLASEGNKNEFKLVHISTDCVFSGKKGGYTESSVKDGIGFYAQSKAIGEVDYGNHLTIRTSIVGPELKVSGIGLFHWFMQQQGEIDGYTKAFWTGVTTFELAKAIVSSIDQNINGIHHLVNENKISKYDLLHLFQEHFQKDGINFTPFNDYEIDKSLLKTKPGFNHIVPSYPLMIEEIKTWITEHRAIYDYNISSVK